MKILILALLGFAPAVYGAQSPTQISGFALDDDVNKYDSALRTETALPIRFMEYLKEVEIKRRPGFKSGYLAYGNCSSLGKIARIKLKYEDSSKKFYEKLLEKYKDRFGEPSQWQGDPFHVVLAWKWVFTDGDRTVELFLQHNTLNDEKKLGNSVKMTDTSLVDSEKDCFKDKYPNFRVPIPNQSKGKSVDWINLVPD